MTELKPCPFCGGEATIVWQYVEDKKKYGVWCIDDLNGFYGGKTHEHCVNGFETSAEAIDAWNTRAERTCHLSKVTSWDDNGHNTWGVICSACDAHIEHNTGYGIRYCPECGARVVK